MITLLRIKKALLFKSESYKIAMIKEGLIEFLCDIIKKNNTKDNVGKEG